MSDVKMHALSDFRQRSWEGTGGARSATHHNAHRHTTSGDPMKKITGGEELFFGSEDED